MSMLAIAIKLNINANTNTPATSKIKNDINSFQLELQANEHRIKYF